jgi:hypothetical protein
LSIDLDPLSCYRDLYGLPPAAGPDPVVATALPRFGELLATLGVRGTAFVVGRTLEDPAAASALMDFVRAGHEAANHTLTHPYDLSRRDGGAISAEVEGGATAISKVTGERPVGFRAPGYLLGARVLPAVAASGAIYDSSLLPSPLYQGIKAAAVASLRLRGRSSRAVLGDPREAFAPRLPYHPELKRPYRNGDGALLELPILAPFGIPLTGTAVALLGPVRARAIAAALSGRPFVNLELHGVDLMDLTSDGLDPALGFLRDLRRPFQEKREAIRAFSEKLLGTHRGLPLREAAKDWLDNR